MATEKGVNGTEKALQNLSAFQTWVATQSDEDFTQITFRGSSIEVK